MHTGNKIGGYTLSRLHWQSTHAELWSAESGGDVVFLQTPRTNSAEGIAWLRREWSLLEDSQLDDDRRTRRWLEVDEAAAIVFEGDASQTLETWAQQEPFSLEAALEVACSLATAVTRLHDAGITIHRICPGSVLVDDASRTAVLTDLVEASSLPLQSSSIAEDADPEALQFVSPEQTGRLYTSVDHRSDLYSLGATLFYLFTGQPPFAQLDPGKLIYAHIASRPVRASERRAGLPNVVDNMLARLLAKEPSARYQSAHALTADFHRCLRSLRASNHVGAFPIGAMDRQRTLRLPDKLYGRKQELSELTNALRLLDVNHCSLAIIRGPSGSGKSALAQRICRSLVEQDGFFVSGKFDQVRNDFLYSAIAKAMSNVVRRLLGEPEREVRLWTKALKTNLGENAADLFAVVPELQSLLGETAVPEPLGPNEAQQRFVDLILRFVRTVASPTRPLVMFFDDLQWASPASLNLLEQMLLDPEVEGLLILTAYRDEEVRPGDALSETLDHVASSIATHTVTLGGLELRDVVDMLVDTVDRPAENVRALAQLIFEKTQGNAFAITELLRHLHREGLLAYELKQEHWHWDLDEIRGSGLASDVVALLEERLRACDARVQEVLSRAACIGNTFETNTVAAISGLDPRSVMQVLDEAARGYLVRPLLSPVALGEDEDGVVLGCPRFAFLHDRIQQVAYSAIPETERQQVHLIIGRHLRTYWSSAGGTDVEVNEVADQLNAAISLIDDFDEREELARLNLTSSERMRGATAWPDALVYARVACVLVDELPAGHPTWRAALEESAFVERLNGNAEIARKQIELLLPHIENVVERARIQNQLVIQYTTRGMYAEAISTGRRALALLGLELPSENLAEALIEALAGVEEKRRGRSFEELAEAEEMTEEYSRAAIEILINLDPATYLSNLELYPLVVSLMVRLSLEYGPVPESAKGYASFGIVLGPLLGRYQEGLEFGELGVQIANRFHHRGQLCRAQHTVANHLVFWVRHIRETHEINAAGYVAGLEVGEVLWAGFIQIFRLYNEFFEGSSLSSLRGHAAGGRTFCERTGHQVGIDSIAGMELTAQSLREASYSNESARGFEEECRAQNSLMALCLYLCAQAEAELYLGRPQEALRLAGEAGPLMPFILGVVSEAGHAFTVAMALLDGLDLLEPGVRDERLLEVDKNLLRLKGWAEECPQNFACRAQLVEAERLAGTGHVWEAAKGYQAAAAAARAEGFSQIEGFAHAREAHLWERLGRSDIAAISLGHAVLAFESWGALNVSVACQGRLSAGGASRSVQRELGLVGQLDLDALMEASRAMSSELDLNKLLPQMLSAIAENAGAAKGLLILDGTEGLRVAALFDQEVGASPQNLGLDETSDLCSERVVRYVRTTGEDVVLEDASGHGAFVDDPFVRESGARSIAALPLSRKGEIWGVLVLANDLIVGAFDARRLRIAKMLLAQATVSLDNARLYERLQARARALIADIDSREKAERERRELETQVRQLQKNEALGSLAAGVAHDFNNLLTAIVGNAELLRIAPGDENYDTWIGQILTASLRAKELVQQILSFSRRSEDSKLAVTDLRGVTEEAVQLLRANAPSDVVVELRGGLESCYVYSLGTQLHQVTMNLGTNAIHALGDKGRVTVSVEVVVFEEAERIGGVPLSAGSWLLLRVEDDGPGMSEELIARAFEPYYTTSAVGTGLGLSIVERIVHEHGGAIDLRSGAGVGTRFDVYLPRTEDLPQAALPTSSNDGLETIGHGQRILFVDDEHSIGKLAETMLPMLGFACTVCGDPLQALEIFESSPNAYDLVISDVRMPGLTGDKLARKIAAIRPDVPIVLLTGRGLGGEDALVEEGVIYGVLHKPITVPTLAATLRKVFVQKV